MTLQEILKSQGLNDEQIEKVVGEMKQNKIFTTNLENADIRYSDLKSKLDTKTAEHTEATNLIETLKKNNANNEVLQGQVGEYESRIEALQSELAETKVNSALKIALLEANVTDVDYLTFKVKEKGKVEIGEDGKIKGIGETIESLRTQYPQHFSTASGGKKIDEKKLPNDEGGDTGLTKKDILSKPYAERQKLYQEDPDKFNEIMNS